MNLKKIRVQLTLLFGAMAAIAVAIIAAFAIKTGTDRIYDSAEREAEQYMKEIVTNYANPWDETHVYDNTWLVQPGDEKNPPNSIPFHGISEVEPPVVTIAADSNLSLIHI